MKKLFLLGLAVFIFTACNNKPERFTSSSSNIDEVKALVSDYNSGNWDSWAHIMPILQKFFIIHGKKD